MESRNTYLRILRQTGATSSVHGLSKILKKNHFIIRVIWTIFFTISLLSCLFSMSVNLSEYFKNQVITKVQVYHDVPATFPQITICNMNPLITGFSRQFMLQVNETIRHEDGNSSVVDYVKLLMAANLSAESRTKLSYTFDEMFIKCTFNSEECQPEDFIWFYDFLRGGCFKFNSGKNSLGQSIELKKVTECGNNGLSLELFVGSYDQMSDSLDLDASGALIFISNQSHSPFEDTGRLLSTAMLTNIVVKRTFKENLPTRLNPCANSNETYSLFTVRPSPDYLYSRDTCVDMCQKSRLVDVCMCYPALFNGQTVFKSDLKQCYTIDEFKCLANALNNLRDEFIQYCSKICPFECKTSTFNSALSYVNYPKEYYAKLFLMSDPKIIEKYSSSESVTFSSLKNKILAVDINYNELAYTGIAEIEYISSATMVANIGGLFGLFLGVSLLSLVEILELGVKLLYEFVAREYSGLRGMSF